MKIPLTQNKFALIDSCDYSWLMQWKWRYNGRYALRNLPRPHRKAIYMHRAILERMGFQHFEHTDHINGDKLDNRRKNLRSATNAQNQNNRGKPHNNTSGFKGVSLLQRSQKWMAQIGVDRKLKYLGCFDSPEEAALVYNRAAREYHGKFAYLNEV